MLICLTVLESAYIWPYIVSTSLKTVELIVSTGAMFYYIEVAIWTHIDALMITVPICEYVAANAVDLGVILGD
jgi:hypothetical protein